jgi:hypothetical protein
MDFVLIRMAEAQTTPGVREAYSFVEKVNEIILFPLITLLMAVALLIFIYGCYEYITHAADSAAHETGKMHILYGIIGMFIMLVAFAILSIAAGTFGLNDELDCANDPLNANCVDSSLYVPSTPTSNGSGPF